MGSKLTPAGFTVAYIAAALGCNRTANTLANWDRVTYELRRVARPAGGWLHAVLHHDAANELARDIACARVPHMVLPLAQCFPFDGYTVHTTGTVPPGDTTGRTNIVGWVRDEPSDEPALPGLLWATEHTVRMSIGVTFITRPR